MKRIIILFVATFFSLAVFAQDERDTTLNRCPVFITDTLTSNNFFLERLPSTIKVTRVKGKLTITIQQKDQFFTIYFNDKKLKNGSKYKIVPGGDRKSEVEAKYSFRSGGTASYVNVSKGTIEASYDKTTDLWRLKLNGTLINMVERSVTYYRAKADFYIH